MEVPMTDAFVIETQGHTAGIAVRDGRELQFFAADSLFWNLENRRFRNLRDVHVTVDAVIAGRRRRDRETRNTIQRRAAE
jgi:hypothetical protein